MSSSASELITQVRQGLDEYNTDAVSDAQILSMLNRAQRQAVSIVSRKYEDAFLASTTQAVSSGTSSYAFPAETYGGRVEMIEYLDAAGTAYSVPRVGFRRTTQWSNTSTSAIPGAWTTIGNSIKLYPTPSASYTLRVWYTKQPAVLTLDQGQITNITGLALTCTGLGVYNATSNPFGFETATARGNNYFNVVDRQTGLVKASLQIASVSSSTGVLTATGTVTPHATVLGKTILSAVPSTVAEYDYVCNIRGGCVSELPDAYHDYLAEYASCHIKRSLGSADEADFIALGALETELEKIWVGRENTARVAMKSLRWSRRGLHN